MARRSKLTKGTRDKICDALSIGATRELASRYARVSYRSMIYWLAAGREERESIEAGNPPDPAKRRYLLFLHAVEDAEADAGISWLSVVDKAAQTDPNWAWRMLKQRFPDGFSDVTQTQVSGPKGGPIDYRDVTELSDAELALIAAGGRSGAAEPEASEE